MTSTQAIASGLDSALLTQAGVPGPIGALIISTVFPSDGLPSYFTEVYQQITKIVNAAITDNDITLVDASINGINDWVRESYAPSKADAAYDRVTLNKDLENHSDKFYNDIAVLRDLGTGTPGFPVFLIAASAHLALLQECALTDPNHPGEDAWNSRFTGQMIATLDDYISYAKKVWPDILAARVACITVENYSTSAAVSNNSDYFAYFAKDAFTGETGDVHEPVWRGDPDTRVADATADANGMISRATATLKESLGDPDTIINNWWLLRNSPLPLASIAVINTIEAEHSAGSINGTPADVYTIKWETTDVHYVQMWPSRDPGNQPASGKRSYIQAHPPGLNPAFYMPSIDPTDPDHPVQITAFDANGKSVSQTFTYTEKDWDPASPVATCQIAQVLGMQTFDWPA